MFEHSEGKTLLLRETKLNNFLISIIDVIRQDEIKYVSNWA